ncbi:TPA: StfH/YfcO family fimbrial adhesin [Escherichia coli]|uniref:StfH/YfcO family fimbrial adhesin n=1 Tax=Escherichia TaxID=561 RepID=UPI000447A046|nr:hypothetical protein AC26_2278 [Escherichia coli 1-176-05_S3_C2]WGM52381.1 StfH/YfcO family fimbrial adhesin [Escherichia ruysiae]HAL9677596.1 DUF2544 domain-containing protein [Escherichia coli]HAV7812879.1 DUF2544 domain-containing protein [Escherichia coli]HAW5066577.1 DUF2544 domain-containing protein [Escherichia coli]
MKKIRLLICLLGLLLLNSAAKADTTFKNVQTYAGYFGSGTDTQLVFYVDVLTPEGAYHGEYYQNGKKFVANADVPNRSWNGPGPAPKLYSHRGLDTSKSSCVGISSNSGWSCNSIPLDITVTGETHGCPWLVTTRIFSVTTNRAAPPDDTQYLGPKANQSTCPTEPVEPYDISWSENSVIHSKLINLKSTGGIIEQTLSTYLMRDNRLCDGSQFDERGAYCRFMAQLMTFSAQGCDNSKVSVTAIEHPITDRQLHDMVIRVDTSSRQPIDATCRFQYILNEL